MDVACADRVQSQHVLHLHALDEVLLVLADVIVPDGDLWTAAQAAWAEAPYEHFDVTPQRRWKLQECTEWSEGSR